MTAIVVVCGLVLIAILFQSGITRETTRLVATCATRVHELGVRAASMERELGLHRRALRAHLEEGGHSDPKEITERIAAISARVRDASGGPLGWGLTRKIARDAQGGEIVDIEIDDVGEDDPPLAVVPFYAFNADANAAFIAHARLDVPWLLARLAGLEHATNPLGIVAGAHLEIGPVTAEALSGLIDQANAHGVLGRIEALTLIFEIRKLRIEGDRLRVRVAELEQTIDVLDAARDRGEPAPHDRAVCGGGIPVGVRVENVTLGATTLGATQLRAATDTDAGETSR